MTTHFTRTGTLGHLPRDGVALLERCTEILSRINATIGYAGYPGYDGELPPQPPKVDLGTAASAIRTPTH